MEIRKAIPADSMTLAMLASRMWDHPAEELAPEFVELTASDEAACFLAFVDRLPVGFARCQLRHDYVEGCETSPVGFLEGIYVDDGHRHAGIAKALLQHACAIAKEMGCAYATLQASPMGQPVYENLGFEDAGTINTWLMLPPGVTL